jgi:3-deoxy-D-manno-octulosonic-acid transferase
MTATGRETALALYGEFAEVRYLPYDYAWLMRRFLRQRRPRLGVLMETELWPNLLGQASRLKVPMVLANARLSARSARGYARLPALTHASLVPVNVAAQSEEDAARLRQLGARAVTVTGNLKFDITPPEDQLELGRRWRAQWASGRLVVLAASTRDGEEAAILPEFAARAADDVMLWIVPRHPQRFDTVAQQIQAAGLRYARRSKLGEGDTMDREVRVLLGDSLGELFAYYAASDVALVGGSLQPLGGQNLIEACSAGCPVLIGPHTFNFEEAARLAIEAGAALRVADARDFWQNAQRLLHDPGSRAAMSAAGLAFAARHRGAAARTAELISPLLAESGIGRSRPDR